MTLNHADRILTDYLKRRFVERLDSEFPVPFTLILYEVTALLRPPAAISAETLGPARIMLRVDGLDSYEMYFLEERLRLVLPMTWHIAVCRMREA